MLDPLAESGFSIMIKGIVFFEEYFDFMDDMTPEEFYEFMGLIRDLRFNGVDTKPEEVNNKVVRLAWRSVRPTVLKSARNARDYEGKKGQKPKQGQEEQVDNSIPTYDISNNEKEKAKEEEVSTYTRKITDEDLEKIYEAEFKGNVRDFDWRIRQTANKAGITQDMVQSQYVDYRENRLKYA